MAGVYEHAHICMIKRTRVCFIDLCEIHTLIIASKKLSQIRAKNSDFKIVVQPYLLRIGHLLRMGHGLITSTSHSFCKLRHYI